MHSGVATREGLILDLLEVSFIFLSRALDYPARIHKPIGHATKLFCRKLPSQLSD